MGHEHARDAGMLPAYRQEYFLRLHARALLIEAVAPIALAVFWWTDSLVTGASMAGGGRVFIWLAGSLLSVALIACLQRIRSLALHGWTTLALLTTLSITFAFLATPTRLGLLWTMPALLIIPVAAAPFWVWMHKNIIACVLCYGCGGILLVRAQAGTALVVGYACLALLCALLCIVIFLAVDGSRRDAYDRQTELDHEAHHDALTGLPSRRRFLELGETAIVATRALARPLAISFIDLDQFKAINDDHGHAAGDRALAIVAGLIARRLDTGMVAARMGGEEFMLLLPGLGQQAAMHYVETLRRIIAATDMGGFRVAISAGVAQCAAGESLAQLMQRADQALLAAKRAGRNQVQCAP
jgi:diguanylate cyclase (GGDEF)-like protein